MEGVETVTVGLEVAMSLNAGINSFSPEQHQEQADPLLIGKRDGLLTLLSEMGRVAVAFSGGVDSAVVAKGAQLACGERAVAVTAVSPSLAASEKEIAEHVAREIGIRHQWLMTDELRHAGYVANAGNRCYYCKTELYTELGGRLEELQADVIVNGANLDDRGDHRPGMTAAREHAVRSPLIEVGLNKQDVRALARMWQLPIWDKPASPCLASRLAYGLEVTPERLARVEAAEEYVRSEFGFREFRVRHELHDLARLEVPVEELARFADQSVREKLVAKFRELGFKFVTLDLEGFRSGSLNTLLPVEVLQISHSRSQASS